MSVSSRHLVLFYVLLIIIVCFCFHLHHSKTCKKPKTPISFSTSWKTSWKKELRLLVETLVWQSQCGAVLQFIAVGNFFRKEKINRVQQFVTPRNQSLPTPPSAEQSSGMNHLLGRISMKIIPQQSHAITFLHLTVHDATCPRENKISHEGSQRSTKPCDTIRNHPKPSHISWVFLTGVSGCSEVVPCTAFRVASTTIPGPFSRK